MTNKLQIAIVTLILLLAYGIGVFGLNRDPIWRDELTSIGNSGGLDEIFTPADVVQSIQTYSAQHTPGYFLALHFWGKVAGWSPVALRLFSLLAGLLTFAFLFRLGKDMLSPIAGMIAAFLLATSVFYSEYLHEIRMYTYLTAFSLAFLSVYWHGMQAKHRLTMPYWAGLWLVSVGLLYSQFFSVLILGAVGIYHLLRFSRAPRWWQMTLTLALAGVMFLPWFLIVITSGFSAFVETETVQNITATNADLLRVLIELAGNSSSLLTVGLLILAGIAAIPNKNGRIIWLWLGIVLGVLLLMNQVFEITPISRMRYFLVAWSLILLVFALGLSFLWRWKMTVFTLLAVWIVAGVMMARDGKYNLYLGDVAEVERFPQYQIMLPALRPVVQAGDLIIGFSQTSLDGLDSKQGKSSIRDYYLGELQAELKFFRFPLDDSQIESLDNVTADNPGIWLTYSPSHMPERLPEIREVIEVTHTACDLVLDEPDMHIERYIIKGFGLDCAQFPLPQGSAIIYSEMIRLDTIYMQTVAQQLSILAHWHMSKAFPTDVYNVSFQVWDAENNNKAQVDLHLDHAEDYWLRADMDLPDLEPASYHLMLIVYGREGSGRLTGLQESTQTASEFWNIGTVIIADE